jgi:GTP cyclohydrolase I
MNRKRVRQNVRLLLTYIGEDYEREGLLDTPTRVANMYAEIFRGYDETQKPNITVFPNKSDNIDYDQMIGTEGTFFSMCEHHMLPFFGKYYFAYLPDNKIVGISKIARIVDFYAAKLQVQERLSKEIVDALFEALEPKGMGIVMKANHLCQEMRGVKKQNSIMTTSELRGVFHEQDVKQEFMRLVVNGGK